MSNMQTPPKRSRRTIPHLKHAGFPGMNIKGLMRNARGTWVPQERIQNEDGTFTVRPGNYPPQKIITVRV